MSALQNLPTDQDQFRQNLEGMGFELPAGDLNDPKYVESLLTDFAGQLEASGIDPEDFTTLVKNYEKQLTRESGNSLKEAVKSSTKTNSQTSGSISLGTAAYLVAIQLALYEILNENMKFFNQMAADNLNIANDLGKIVASKTKESIEKDAYKELVGGFAKLGSGLLGAGAHAGLKGYRAARPHSAQEGVNQAVGRSGKIKDQLNLVNTSRTQQGTAVTSHGTAPAAEFSDAALNESMKKQILNESRCFGSTPLTEKEHAFIKHAGLHDEVEAKLHFDSGKIDKVHGDKMGQIQHEETQIGQYANMGTQIANSGTEAGLSFTTKEKAELEAIKNLGETSKQALQQISRDSAEQASAAARQAEASLEVLKKLDSDKR
jgi:hypothetical protein